MTLPNNLPFLDNTVPFLHAEPGIISNAHIKPNDFELQM